MSFSSCTVTQNLSFTENSSGTLINADDFFLSVLDDFSQWSDDEVLSLDSSIVEFACSLSETQEAENVTLSKDKNQIWDIAFNFKDFNNLMKTLAGSDGKSFAKLTDEGFEFSLSMNNYNALVSLVPVLENPNLAAYGPEYNHGMTKEDYLEMISFILGEDGPDSIESSYIELTVNTPSDIKYTNGIIKSPRQAVFRTPLIDFLLLPDEIKYICRF